MLLRLILVAKVVILAVQATATVFTILVSTFMAIVRLTVRTIRVVTKVIIGTVKASAAVFTVLIATTFTAVIRLTMRI